LKAFRQNDSKWDLRRKKVEKNLLKIAYYFRAPNNLSVAGCRSIPNKICRIILYTFRTSNFPFLMHFSYVFLKTILENCGYKTSDALDEQHTNYFYVILCTTIIQYPRFLVAMRQQLPHWKPKKQKFDLKK